MIINIRLFASYREKAGKAELELSLPIGALVSDAIREVLRLHPAIAGDPARLMIAVNQEYQPHDYPLSDHDEVALIPPVSGGAPSSPSR